MSIRIPRFIATAVLIATFTTMCIWTVRMALADWWLRQGTLLGTRKAISLEPDSSTYYARLAAIVQESSPIESTQALQRAVALNPWDSQSWMELGLRAESTGDLTAAEAYLLRAAKVDKQYLPKWTLVNYYFRRGDSRQFWVWARRTVEVSYGDLTPLFNLCWKTTSDGALIEDTLDIRKPDIEANYLAYLTSHNLAEPMTRSAARLLTWSRPADVQVLLAACDRLIEDNSSRAALDIWNGLAALHTISYQVLDPKAGRSLTNGDFHALPASQGFDWRMSRVDGVTILRQEPMGLQITFSGRQPENCAVLTQYVPVMHDAKYELRYAYNTSGIAPATGVTWHVTDTHGTKILAQGESLASESQTEGRVIFQTLPDSGLVRLVLAYQRALGTTRIEGSITLKKVEVAPLSSRNAKQDERTLPAPSLPAIQ
jgi:tetratricopeptide (TPR) repeat protein